MTMWAIEDSNGQVLLDFACTSRVEVGRRIVPVHFDAFRLQVSSSYREIFDRAVKQVLEREGWQIVQVSQRKGYRYEKEPPDSCDGRWLV